MWRYTCTHVVTAADPDPLPNTATVTGNDMDGRTTEDTASSLVDIIPAEVLGVTLTQPATLPRTGAPVRTLITTGLTLMLLGFALYRIRRPNPLTS